MAGLLDALLSRIDSGKRSARNRIADVLANPGDFVEMVNDQAANYNRAVEPVVQSNELFNRAYSPEAKQQRDMDLAMALMPAGVGHIAYHGSPHKFDKFALEKIGTGEGAQAYGHGLYLAETPEVAKAYSLIADQNPTAQQYLKMWGGDKSKALAAFESQVADGAFGKIDPAKVKDVVDSIRGKGNIYKTDIPDESLSRMLDWDKPLSQQAPEVQPVLRNMLTKAKKSFSGIDPNGDPIAGQVHHLYAQHRGGNIVPVSEELSQAGIPGIRYLDGGSRGAGEGSSNFVVFSPEMIRILERNGLPTGQQPWKPGEWSAK